MPLSVQAFHLLGEAGLIPEKSELIAGFVFVKMAISPPHSFYVNAFVTAFRPWLQPGFSLRQEQPITTDEESEPQPDVALVRGEWNDFRHRHPTTAEIIVEIALSSSDLDHRKTGLYAAAGVGEYWIVLPDARRVEVHADPLNGEYARRQILTRPEDTLTTIALPGFRMALEELFPRD